MDTIIKQNHRFSRSSATGAAVYQDYRDNFAIWPGREAALDTFVRQPYGRMQHKLRPTKSSNSEDALTWSCFDTLKQLENTYRAPALASLWSLAFDSIPIPAGFSGGEICVGKTFGSGPDKTETDVSIEGDGVLVFIEAKLYSSMSLKDESKGKPHDQIAKKLRVGIKEGRDSGKEFYFIILDIAPKEVLRTLEPRASLDSAKRTKPSGFRSKWKTAYWYSRYKGSGGSVSPLHEVLKDIAEADARAVARNMGWLTWPDVYKAVLRALIASRSSTQ